jgi:hypothetical protein
LDQLPNCHGIDLAHQLGQANPDSQGIFDDITQGDSGVYWHRTRFVGPFQSVGCLGDFEIWFCLLNPDLSGWRYKVGESGIYAFHVCGVVSSFFSHLIFYGDDDPRRLDV